MRTTHAVTEMNGNGKNKSQVIADLPAACSDERTAVEFMERQRWGDDPHCPRCESRDVYMMKDRATGGRQKDYRWRCKACKQHYTVRIGSILEDSRIPLHHWCFAFWRACTSKKGVSALEIQRQTGLSYKSALFLLHRIRFAMQDTDQRRLEGDVIADETFIGGKSRYRGQRKSKAIVMALIEKGGEVRVRPIADVSAKTLKEAVRQHVRRQTRLMTDENAAYYGLGRELKGGHYTVNHSKYEYARGDVTTNHAESFFALLKRGIHGIYHNVSRKHLHRYLSEFEFRFNHRKMEDGQRTVAAIQAGIGKRLMYREPVGDFTGPMA